MYQNISACWRGHKATIDGSESNAVSCLVLGALSAPTAGPEPEPAQLAERQGYYWSSWQEGSGSYNCKNEAGGKYSVTWQGQTGGFVCGKGWSPGGSRAVKYTGTYTPTGPGYLSLYGWTTNPLIEYYIVDSYGTLEPGEPWTRKGNFTFEEGTYELFQSTRVNKPSIVGTATFQQYWSVRTEKRVGGTITTGKHFDAWKSVGMKLGGHNYMILATEGYTNGKNTSSGSSSITVS
ncbi:glycoside hydrolase family 11 protein [Pleomassaria siparia CBS 279.74]|uniref:Endo-1,4-beta-xylanase n=1 Tax=Pleomassaria siparia CBS 279.74 TaxID=1314801 RepID=A0A6G1JSQ2_9PLEO|nr:glycoside hydrolase family 11 protein [Pleomassaria siparia CBS 279.74]